MENTFGYKSYLSGFVSADVLARRGKKEHTQTIRVRWSNICFFTEVAGQKSTDNDNKPLPRFIIDSFILAAIEGSSLKFRHIECVEPIRLQLITQNQISIDQYIQ